MIPRTSKNRRSSQLSATTWHQTLPPRTERPLQFADKSGKVGDLRKKFLSVDVAPLHPTVKKTPHNIYRTNCIILQTNVFKPFCWSHGRRNRGRAQGAPAPTFQRLRQSSEDPSLKISQGRMPPDFPGWFALSNSPDQVLNVTSKDPTMVPLNLCAPPPLL